MTCWERLLAVRDVCQRRYDAVWAERRVLATELIERGGHAWRACGPSSKHSEIRVYTFDAARGADGALAMVADDDSYHAPNTLPDAVRFESEIRPRLAAGDAMWDRLEANQLRLWLRAQRCKYVIRLISTALTRVAPRGIHAVNLRGETWVRREQCWMRTATIKLA